MSEMIAPPSAPLLSTTLPAESPIPLLDDDIPDPVVPADVQEAVPTPSTRHATKKASSRPQEPTSPAPPPPAWAEHESLLVGFCSALQAKLHDFMLDEHTAVMATLDATLVTIKKWMEVTAQANEHAQYQLSDALLQLRNATPATPASPAEPYWAALKALSPAGYPTTIHVSKTDPDELCAALEGWNTWLSDHGYTPVPR